ncbi:hypothetical protein [Paenibacillus agaridevorans]|uniref:hypothetical protein n=1 Tax=Paenibacillus agaridevorans TaxID=171404 RepID=UPI00248475D8|nr:hypothetical protein [Paenibacillus agaridevorans]
MFRSHGTDTPREVWRFGEPGSIWYDTLVRFIRLRYRLGEDKPFKLRLRSIRCRYSFVPELLYLWGRKFKARKKKQIA